MQATDLVPAIDQERATGPAAVSAPELAIDLVPVTVRVTGRAWAIGQDIVHPGFDHLAIGPLANDHPAIAHPVTAHRVPATGPGMDRATGAVIRIGDTVGTTTTTIGGHGPRPVR